MKRHLLRNLALLAIILLISIVPFLNTITAGFSYRTSIINNISQNDMRGPHMFDLLIISPYQFIDELQLLVSHKERMGVSTRLVSLCDIYDQMYWQGRDEAEKIKYFIKEAIEQWGTKYILLVGGKMGQLPLWYCPVRYVHMQCDWEAEFISDLYFADIYDENGNFSSWDSDGDGIFGEWYFQQYAEDQDIDLTPDVAVGRLPCRYEFEVTVMVDKIIKYETLTSDQPWFRDFTVFAGDTYPVSYNPNWTGYEGEYYGDLAIDNMPGFQPYRYYTSDGTLTGYKDVRQAINKGCGFAYFVGHGSPSSWGNHPPDSDVFIDGLHVYNVFLFLNFYKLPVCVISGCHNLQFDVDIFNVFNKTKRWRCEATFESIGWRLTRKILGGSIATIGTSALGFTKEDKDSFSGGINEIEVEFFNQYGNEEKEILGDAFNGAIEWYVETYPINWNTSSTEDSWIDTQVVQSWTLFGDPSLKIGGYSQ